LSDGFEPVEDRAFETPMMLGVLADTHVYRHGQRRLSNDIVDLFRRFEVDLILHAGDVNTVSVLDQLAEVAPVMAVLGNNDDVTLTPILPLSARFSIGPWTFALIHGHLGRTAREQARSLAGKVDCVVYGHSHIPKIEREAGTILFNPGSATDRRWQEHFGVGLIHVTDKKLDPELVLYANPVHVRNVVP
jgi:putative phosphoesterase